MRIVTVLSTEKRATQLIDMSYIRWAKISEALARLGYQVDMATAEFKWKLRQPVLEVAPNLRRVPIRSVKWLDYDVVKTLFHRGFTTLERYGGANHPFIISKLGSVVGPRDMDGIYFYGRQREQLYRVQERINGVSRYITVLSEQARQLWAECHGGVDRLLLVPGAADREVPEPREDPYLQDDRKRCIFAGNIYSDDSQSQRQAHAVIVAKLNELGRLLDARRARLYVVGPGDARKLDSRYVTYCGVTSYDRSWDYLHYANVGIVVSAGRFMHNNESTKIYHYLRVGLPTVCEEGFPNDNVLRESRMGFLVPSGNLSEMASRTIEAAERDWDRDFAIKYTLEHHTWDRRVMLYDRLFMGGDGPDTTSHPEARGARSRLSQHDR